MARETHVVAAPGHRHARPARRLRASGVAAWRLGAGRARKEDPVSAGAGVVLHAKPGDEVRAGEPLLTLHADDAASGSRARSRRWRAGSRSTARTAALPLVLDRIEA